MKKQKNPGKNLTKWDERHRFVNKNRWLRLSRKKGQVTVELILLGVVLIILAQLILSQIKDNEYVENFAKGPSQVIANMLANGNWKKDPTDSKSNHPNSHNRHYSWDP